MSDLGLGASPTELVAFDVKGDGTDEIAVVLESEILVIGRSCE